MPLDSGAASATTGGRCFGIQFTLSDGVDDLVIWVARDDRFGPDYQPCVTVCSNLDFELAPVWGKSGIPDSDFSFTILNEPLMHARDTAHTSAWDLISQGYTYQGQLVDVYIMALDAQGVASDAPRWRGYLVDAEFDGHTITFSAIATTSEALKEAVPEEVVSSDSYVEAPPGVLGVSKPIIYGDFLPELHACTSSENDAYKKVTELMGLTLPLRVVPAICTDTNETEVDQPIEFLVANHELKTFPVSSSASVFYYEPTLGQLAVMDSDSFSTTNSGTATISLDRTPTFSVWIKAVEEDTTTNTTGNDWEYACQSDDTEYATLGSGEKLSLICERPPDLGVVRDVKIFMLGDVGGGGLPNGYLYLWDIDDASIFGGSTSIGVTGDYGTFSPIHEHTLTAGTVTHVEDFPANFSITVSSDDAAILVRYIVLVVYYTPHLIYGAGSPGSQGRTRGERPPGSGSRYWSARSRPRAETIENDNFPDLTGDNVLFAACEGTADSVGGTYTNSANSLIDLPCTIAYHLLASYGNTNVSNTAPGDIDDITTDQAGFDAALYLGPKETYGDILNRLCIQGAMAVGIRPSLNMYLNVVYWGSAASDNLYGTAIDFANVLADQDFVIGHTSRDEVRNAFFVHCDFDPRTNKNLTVLDYDSGDDADLLASENKYRRKEKVIVAPNLLASAGDNCRDEYVEMLAGQRVVLRFATNWAYHDLQPGHVIEIDNDSWVAAGRLYPGATGGTDGAWSAGGTTRYFWVTRVSLADEGYMEIEASEGVW